MKTKIKVVAYIYRIKNGNKEILVFDHRHQPEAGTQVIGGTLEPGEDLEVALLREIAEESGLLLDKKDIRKKIGETHYARKDIPEINHRHYFAIQNNNLKDKWAHTVLSDGADNGLIFDFFWLTIPEAKIRLTGNFGELLDEC